MGTFIEFGVSPEICKAVEDMGWMLATPIQTEAIPLILGGGDVMGAAETGSGKTGAFALPILQVVHESLQDSQKSSQGNNRSKSVICELNNQDKSSGILTISGNVCDNPSQQWQGCRCTVGAFAGKVYFEMRIISGTLGRVGWSPISGNYDIGTDQQTYGYGSTGKKSNARQFVDYGGPYKIGEVIGCLLDCGTGVISYTKNGSDLGEAFQIPQQFRGQPFYPAVTIKSAKIQVNFENSRFEQRLPQGYSGIANAPLDETTTPYDNVGADTKQRKPLCIIMEPTYELAEQTYNNIELFKVHLKNPQVISMLLVGGQNIKHQLSQIKNGVDIITATPQRLNELANSGQIDVSRVRFFCLDETDRLIDTGNYDLIVNLYKKFPKLQAGTDRLQVLMFSATLHSDEVRKLADVICQNPQLIDLKGKDSVPDTVDHVQYQVDWQADRSWLQSNPQVFTDNSHKFDTIAPNNQSPECASEAQKRLKQRVLQRIIDHYKMDQCLIFCRTNFDCDNLEKFMNNLGGGKGYRGQMESGKENPYSCCVLAGQRNINERKEALSAFKQGYIRFLICTDVAARGLDIKELPYVINTTLPDKSEDYIHRVGRVGRADHIGLAISIVSKYPEKVWYCSIKGYKPWLNPKKQDVLTNEEGGHTIWYDEQKLMGAIEERLGQPVEHLNEDLSLPPSVQAKVRGGGKGTSTYGQKRGGGEINQETQEHINQISGNVQKLAQLETKVQISYWNIRERFKNSAAKAMK